MTKLKTILFILVLMVQSFLVSAQTKSGIGETMRSSGRIYVVVGVLVIIFAGIILYLVRLERKMSRLEKADGPLKK